MKLGDTLSSIKKIHMTFSWINHSGVPLPGKNGAFSAQQYTRYGRAYPSWFAKKQISKVERKVRLGRRNELTLAILEKAAKELEQKLDTLVSCSV